MRAIDQFQASNDINQPFKRLRFLPWFSVLWII